MTNVSVNRSAPSTLTGKVNQLELILRQLQHDLRKVSRCVFFSLLTCAMRLDLISWA